MAEKAPNGLKTLWEKQKLLFTSNFSFSHSVFKRLVLQTRKKQGLFGKGLIEEKMSKSKRGHKSEKDAFYIVSIDSMNCSLDSEHIPRVLSKYIQ